jgi:hypothetical protein
MFLNNQSYNNDLFFDWVKSKAADKLEILLRTHIGADLLNKCSFLVLTTSFRRGQIYKRLRYDFGHTVVLLKYDLDVQQTQLWDQLVKASLLNKGSCLTPALGMTKFIIVENIIWVTLCCAT